VRKKIVKICAAIMAASGVIIIFASLYPLISYQWESAQKYPMLISPLVDEETASFKFTQKDFTHVEDWIDDGLLNSAHASDSVKYYTISIPELGIDSATVSIGGDDLSDSLVQYEGTALPGKIGNAVIFGHSVLPTFFNPENYLTIFSTLPRLDIGDGIFVNYDGIEYKYVVEDMFEVKPKDIQILEQNSSAPYLTLVTCTPPGHPLKPKRLIVRARLIPES
jgi:sortase A